MNVYKIEYTDTFGGDANYSWVERHTVRMPELTHYGYDGSQGYARAKRIANRELLKKAKALVGLTGVRGKVDHHGDTIEFRPYRMATVLFIDWNDSEE